MTVRNSSNNVGGMVQIHGLAELQRTLDQLPAKIEANVLRGALRAGANVIANEARRLVPVANGLPMWWRATRRRLRSRRSTLIFTGPMTSY